MLKEHFDVITVGAGLSGISAGYHLQKFCPGKKYAILEGRPEIGGTWSLFQYPGIRSDSDMFTLGYSFRPWKEAKAIADGPSILKYVRDTASEFGIDKHIRFEHKVLSASWSDKDLQWTIEVEVGPKKEKRTYSASFLYICSGYYNYEKGFTPKFPEIEKFKGKIIHPQFWPKDLDYRGKKVVVIGSGATAVTLVPSMADQAAHITMLQRSPTYITSLPSKDIVADILRFLLPAKLAHHITRIKNILIQIWFYQLCKRSPNVAKWLIRARLKAALPKGYDVDTHFKPSYQPWDQRVCLVPDSDLFKAISKGKASIETDQIDGFTAHGIKLRSGKELEADIVVTATGLDLVAVGGIRLTVNGSPVDISKLYTFKGLMLSDIPNFAFCVGYTNASWTLRADLTSTYVARLLNHMDSNGYTKCVPLCDESKMEREPILDLNSGYIQRAIDKFPVRGANRPWRFHQNYLMDLFDINFANIKDSNLSFR
ncbi:NAD(P)/FAD-dependent oxidoreductase [Leptospira langatensis]|uniref:NAD(P)/FAD-dependent oxidoreductase n=1 Tax=Leptospira langatensis TaxID=2484983 RepID=A0A5F1ZQX4_9LEPT|nr:NAD(P)/FAD-dependent oxidoreductase [Leptospira langatensis]TGK02599.1 NAD(P)/FAD-dependent oxidoreductase [Leptospira langatensis]TGL40200.1 NAD(P)/FAD-dependent oxidoreductase [Leptospira langatensis]